MASKSDNKQENKTGPRDDNKIMVSTFSRSAIGYTNIATKILEKFDTVELHGLGNAIPLTAEIAQNLKVSGSITYQKIHTNQVFTQGRKPELVIILKKN